MIRALTGGIVAGLLAASPALADEPVRRWSVSVSGEGHSSPDPSGHGAVLVAVERLGRAGQSVFAEINTETLRVGATNLPVAPRARLHAVATGEALIAGLQPDFWRQDRLDRGAGFYHSYARADLALDVHLGRGHQITPFAGAGARWFADTSDTDRTTADAEIDAARPADFGFAEAGARYTWWGLASDDAWSDRHRFFARLDGSAVDVTVSGRIRSEVTAWTLDPEGEVDGPRNTPDTAGVTARARALSGVRLGTAARLQLEQHVVVSTGLDDTERARVGGMNPWVVPLAGAPWAGYVPDHVAAQRTSLHIGVGSDTEVGPIVDVAWIDDVDRTGGAAGVRGGVGAFIDARVGAWQLDVRTGYAPPSGTLDAPGRFTVFAGLGRDWRSDRR